MTGRVCGGRTTPRSVGSSAGPALALGASGRALREFNQVLRGAVAGSAPGVSAKSGAGSRPCPSGAGRSGVAGAGGWWRLRAGCEGGGAPSGAPTRPVRADGAAPPAAVAKVLAVLAVARADGVVLGAGLGRPARVRRDPGPPPPGGQRAVRDLARRNVQPTLQSHAPRSSGRAPPGSTASGGRARPGHGIPSPQDTEEPAQLSAPRRYGDEARGAHFSEPPPPVRARRRARRRRGGRPTGRRRSRSGRRPGVRPGAAAPSGVSRARACRAP